MPGDSNTVSQTPSQEEFQTQMNTDFKLKDSSMFTGTWGDQARWPRLLVFCDSPIPLSHQVYKTVAGMNKVLDFALSAPLLRPRAVDPHTNTHARTPTGWHGHRQVHADQPHRDRLRRRELHQSPSVQGWQLVQDRRRRQALLEAGRERAPRPGVQGHPVLAVDADPREPPGQGSDQGRPG